MAFSGVCTNTIAAPASDTGKWFKAEKPITDAQGRIRYIVMLEADNTVKPKEKFKDVDAAIAWKIARSSEYIDSVSKSKGGEVTILSATHLSVPTFVAYLTEKQAKDFANDKHVVSMTEDRTMQTSTSWTNSTDPSGQTRSWGIKAMNNELPVAATGSATVYVIDLGVEMHADLPGLHPYNQLHGSDMMSGLVNGTAHHPVGCWPHATHVAGIIGAQDNSYGVVGMLPGANIVSIATGEHNYTASNGYFYVAQPNSPIFCSGGPAGFISGPDQSAINQALELVMYRTMGAQRTAVVNMSLNGGSGIYTVGSVTAAIMNAVATPKWLGVDLSGCVGECIDELGFWYTGSLIVQSAGNQFEPACDFAYKPNLSGAPLNNDGIIVVGGLNQSGQPVPNGGYPFPGKGSNDGSCVEMWAPSTDIVSTWTINTIPEFSTGSPYRSLSGTSMAAPHVVGFAARLLEQNPWGYSSSSLEQAVRAKLVYMDAVDNHFISVYMPKF